MENEELVEKNEASARAIEKQEGEANEDQDKEPKEEKTEDFCGGATEFDNDQDCILNEISSQAFETMDGDTSSFQNEDQYTEPKESKTQNIDHDKYDNEQEDISDQISSQTGEKLEGDAFTILNDGHESELKEEETQTIGHDGHEFDERQGEISDTINEVTGVKLNTHEEIKDNVIGESELSQRIDESEDLQYRPQQENFETSEVPGDMMHESNSVKYEIQPKVVEPEYSGYKVDDRGDFESKNQELNADNNAGQNGSCKEKEDDRGMESSQINREAHDSPTKDNNLELVLDGTEASGMEGNMSTYSHCLDANPETPRVVEKALALKNFVKVKSSVAVSSVFCRLLRKSDEGAVGSSDHEGKDISDLSKDIEIEEDSEKTVDKTTSIVECPQQPIGMKGRIILYTRLGCQESKEVRLFLYRKRLRYVEINIDVYPSRKNELDIKTGSTSVPKVFFNEIFIGGLSEIKTLNDSGKLDEKIDFLITHAPSFQAPFPPLSGEDDASSGGALDEMALIVRKMKETIVVKDRFSKMRRFTNCFLGSEAVDFLSEDQYLERTEAVQFARKLASKLFFQHVQDENLFEDGNQLYRFLEDDPIVASQCHNIPRGLITVKPKPIIEIASRLRFMSNAMFEAYVSEDGRHVDYRSIHGSEEFARYLRLVEELQRVEIWDFPREEKLAFFINLYNMMAIHAIMIWGHPSGTLERRKLFADFKYVIGGFTYSLSIIQNGILRGNQRLPYTLTKPFNAKDKRVKVALPYPEPLINFSLVFGTRSGPALRWYSPGDIDKELVDAARDFLRSGGLSIDFNAKVAYASKTLKWFSVDFGKNEVEVLKHMSNYLDPADSELLLDMLATSELKVIYKPFDWSLNC